jgi:hypothetical protein
MTTEADVVLDLADDFDEALARAMANRGADPVLALLEPADPPCCRATALNRLRIRRHAARRQRPGESWSYLDILGLVDDELARMKASADESRGCGSCIACDPPRCGRCGGQVPCAVAGGSGHGPHRRPT